MNAMRRRILALLWLVPSWGALACGAADANAPNGPQLALASTPAAPRQGDVVEVRATVTQAFGLAYTHSWSVLDPQARGVALPDEHAEQISFVATEVGVYKVSCDTAVEGGVQLHESLAVSVAPTSATPVAYLARVIPPPESGLAPFEQTFVVTGVDTSETWTLPATREVAISLAHDGQPLPAFVTVLLGPDDAQPQRSFLPAGQGKVALSGAASLLLLPETDQVAPLVRSIGQTASALDVTSSSADSGLALTGTVDQAGVPLAGVSVAVHTIDAVSGIDVPSTVGRSAADGSFALLARSGRATLVVVPPAPQTLPLARVDDPQLLLAEPGATGWVFSYGAVTPVQIGGVVVDADGKPLSSARVVFSARELADVGTLTLGGKSYGASGSFRVELSTDGSGALRGPQGGLVVDLPPGRYDIEIRPPDGHAASYTLREEQLTASTTLALTTRRKAVVSGAVLDAQGRPVLARVELRAAQGSVATVANEQGAFQLSVDSGLDYALAVRALLTPSGAPLLQAVLRVDGDTSLGGLALVRALQVNGILRTAAGSAVSGALVRVLCVDAACPRQGLIDEVRSGAGGAFVLRVPAEAP